MTEPTGRVEPAGFPDLALFTRGRTRGAVVRGLLRTAWLVFLLYLLWGLLGSVVGFTLFHLHDRDGAFERIGVVGLTVAHPGVDQAQQSSGTKSWGWLHTTKTDRYLQPDGSSLQTVVRMDALGRISVKTPPGTKLDEALYEGRASRAQATSFVAGLPASAVADVVLDFTTPSSAAAVFDLLERHHLNSLLFNQITFYEDPFAGPRRAFRDDGHGSSYTSNVAPSRSVAWSHHTTRYTHFSDWARDLRGSDDGDLARLGLPDSATIKKLGAANLIHGIFVTDVTPDQLTALLQDADVRTLTPVDVRLTILHRDQS